jgi:DnaJ-class molecular chaperone
VQRQSGKVEQIQVKIPAGIDDGKRIRLRGQGGEGIGGGSPGDLLIRVRVAPHPFFTRRGNRLEVEVLVTLGEAARGAKIDVPTPKGTISLKIPPGTSSGTKLRIKGHGVNPKGDSAGDLFAAVQIILPNDLSPQEQDELGAISDRHPQNPRANLRW